MTSTSTPPHRLDFATALTQWDYAPAPESVKPEIAGRYGLFIGGEFVEPHGSQSRGTQGDYFPTVNPATEATLAEIAQAGEADVDAAVRAAREALPAWAGLPAKERGKYLYRIARRIQERARELAVLETMDGGKPIRESRDVDVPLAAAHFFYHAGWADKLRFAFPGWHGCPSRESGSTAGTAVPPTPLPIGVCGQIIPWNFPLLMAAWKLAPALACGNTCVLKPAETTPLTALRLAEICQEVGLPRGVVNVVTGDGRTGAALVNHPDVDKIAFTGSTEVGKRIARAVAENNYLAHGSESRATKRLTLELGGKSPNIIFEDASLDQAVEGIIEGIYFNQGHVCCAGSRLFVQESVLDEVIAKLKIRMASLRVGDPLDKNTDVGAINSREQLGTISRYLGAGCDEGATLHVGGAVNGLADRWNGTAGTAVAHGAVAQTGKGYWCRPSFFTGVQPSHTIAREEIFGPVLAVMSFRTPEEAITRANNTPYGLAAGVWTDKGSKIFEIASKLKAGVVWLNSYNKFDPASPFGGFKESGFGREGGLQGLRGYVKA
ncbi:MAG: aldehyde dehydrogenase family protein [Phycisphaerales bacterium]|nr:aldehyde dehydrogenase family protein [Phycisphaerales bacterium]